MKVKVIKKYVDKHTKEIHRVGEELTYNNNRGEELKAAGYVEEIKEKADKAQDEE